MHELVCFDRQLIRTVNRMSMYLPSTEPDIVTRRDTSPVAVRPVSSTQVLHGLQRWPPRPHPTRMCTRITRREPDRKLLLIDKVEVKMYSLVSNVRPALSRAVAPRTMTLCRLAGDETTGSNKNKRSNKPFQIASPEPLRPLD